jgi:hypothetical protein
MRWLLMVDILLIDQKTMLNNTRLDCALTWTSFTLELNELDAFQ